MKRILAATILAADISLLVSQPATVGASQRSNNDQAVRKLLDELYAALGSADTAALDRIYADSYGLVNDDGTVTTKAPRLAAIKSREAPRTSTST